MTPGINPKIAVLYHCHPINNGVNHLNFFLQQQVNPAIDYFISTVDVDPTLIQPHSLNSEVIAVENDSHDYGGFSRILGRELISFEYDYFFFINSSCIGPFLPTYYEDDWTDAFIGKMTKGVEAVGSTINCLPLTSPYSQLLLKMQLAPPYYHIQTYAYCLSRKALELLMSVNFFKSPTQWSKTETILNYEILLSKILTKSGMNIAALASGYQNLDFSRQSEETLILEKIGDPCFQGAIFGRSLSRFETIFVKPSRNYENLTDIDL